MYVCCEERGKVLPEHVEEWRLKQKRIVGCERREQWHNDRLDEATGCIENEDVFGSSFEVDLRHGIIYYSTS